MTIIAYYAFPISIESIPFRWEKHPIKWLITSSANYLSISISASRPVYNLINLTPLAAKFKFKI